MNLNEVILNLLIISEMYFSFQFKSIVQRQRKEQTTWVQLNTTTLQDSNTRGITWETHRQTHPGRLMSELPVQALVLPCGLSYHEIQISILIKTHFTIVETFFEFRKVSVPHPPC